MKVVIALLGLVIGAFIGGALLMLNPIALTQPRPVALSGTVQTFGWQSGGGYRGMPLTPRGLLGATTARGAEAGFEDAGIRHARVEVVLLTAEAGAVPALGVKLAATSRSNSLLGARLGTATAWNIVWPGRGSVLLSGSENFWAPLRDGLWSAVRGRGFQPGQASYTLTPLPGLGPPAVAGGSGDFAGASGSFREEFSPAEGDPAEFTGLRQLHLALE
jgi:hypothetical protein